MLVRKCENLVVAHEADFFRKGGQEYLRSLWSALDFINPKDYRGIAREPLEPWSLTDERLLREKADTLKDIHQDETARRRFLALNREDREEWITRYRDGWNYNTALIQELNVAQELQRLVDTPEDFEIIEVARSTFGTKFDFLGFDIGYWGSDHFSLICDSVVMPRWHPPEPELFEELGKHLYCLNNHLLFLNPEMPNNSENITGPNLGPNKSIQRVSSVSYRSPQSLKSADKVTRESLSEAIERIRKINFIVLCGCCGTGPKYIKAVTRILRK
jgi:hypothetical protein